MTERTRGLISRRLLFFGVAVIVLAGLPHDGPGHTEPFTATAAK